MNEQLLRLDISKRPDASQTVRIGQGDVGGTTIVADVYDNGAALDLTGMDVRFLMRLPGGRYYVRDYGCTAVGNRVTYVVDEEHMCAIAGYTDCAYFEVLQGTEVVASTQRFRIEVLRSALDGSVPGESYDTAIDEAIARADAAAEEAREAAGGTVVVMSETRRGGAKLGDGLSVGSDERLSVAPLTTAQIDTVANDGALASANVLDGTRLAYLWGKLRSKFASLVGGAVAVAQGGTGKTTHTANAVLAGNGTGAVKNIQSDDGALYATSANGAPAFGTLPIAQGGTNATNAAGAAANIVGGQSIAPSSVAATNGVTAATVTASSQVSVSDGTTVHQLTDKANYSTLLDVERSIASTESATATTSHAVGEYVMLRDGLFRVTAPISAGSAIAVGTNVVAVKVMDEATDADRMTAGTLAIGRGGTGQDGTTIETVVGDIVTAGAGCSIASAEYAQWGKMAHVVIGIMCTSAKSSGDTLATIVSGKRPATTALLMPTFNSVPSCSLNTVGNIVVRGSLGAGTTLYVIGTYLLP